MYHIPIAKKRKEKYTRVTCQTYNLLFRYDRKNFENSDEIIQYYI